MSEIKEATFAQYAGIPDYVVAADDRGVIDASFILQTERTQTLDQYTPYKELVEYQPRHAADRRSSLASSALARFGIFETEARHKKPRKAKTRESAYTTTPAIEPLPVTG